ncbi:HupE/UreJ family protein [Neobacillus rhizophilus]|uniref:HupE/UreJ family protein n=1 Tax=Neobacillus rhizophilus TaxID=2833579 RepID=A0A942U9T9_9BACI|nr:HupE/UreJ family protein [Neobacillus rhizophilus]MBS4215021.1 HupE/UreJ family protein [Neobacillus rhizophilus]
MQKNNKLMASICLIFMMAVFLLQPNGAEAHSGSIGYSEVKIEGNKVSYDLYLLADLLGGLLNIDANQDGYMKEDEIAQSKTSIEQFVLKNLTVNNNGLQGKATINDISLVKRSNLSMFRIKIEFVFKEPVQEYEIDYFIFFNGVDMNHQNFATIHNGDQVIENIFTKDHTVLQGNTYLKKEKTTGETVETSNNQNKVIGFWQYVLMGMEHIWSGIDHLLFLFGLLLAKGNFRDYVKTLTAFTIGHCLTLALAATETVFIPSTNIEPLIALSIVYVAIQNIWSKSFKWRWLVGLGFGLIHGFGFAELLIGKLGSHFVLPLFSFNLGVEFGQIVVLIIFIPFIWYLQKARWQRQFVNSFSTVISGIGLYWFIDRII